MTPNQLDRLPAPKRGRTPVNLTRKQKAAIIVRLLLNEGAEVPVGALPEDMQADLTQQMGSLRYVNRDVLKQVVQEFASELDAIGLAFPGGMAGALSVLDGKISPRTAARLRKEAGVRQSGDPWDRIRDMEAKDLVDFATTESVEVSAVLLSKLRTTVAADLLALLPGDRARKIAYAVQQTKAVTPDAVDRIGLSIIMQLDGRPDIAFAAGPDARVGEILNVSLQPIRESVLEGLEEEDKEFADAVRRAIFTFEHIKDRVDEKDCSKLIRAIDQQDFVLALASGEQAGYGDVVDYILANISRRMAEQLRESIGEAGKIKSKDGEVYMNRLVTGIRDLVTAGDLVLSTGEDDDDE
ncbi:flagellar motor switch protein FliG [Mesobacterium pallidum]|uniref:flagellar motor switch protein FliG n=1 Tax=Mesobacterium pallidum TaxID=2872037 RepID=UPI001EE1E921|nr:FliG C-terminal domain-containing protein [Mesobacterium pallidum]